VRVGLPVTGPVGDRLEVWTIREADDPLMSVPWTVCIKDASGNLVLEQQLYHDVGIDPDVKIHLVDVTNLSSGVYRVDIYNFTSCTPPEKTITYSYYIHRTGGVTSVTPSSDWGINTAWAFALYIYDGKIFYSSGSYGVTVPVGADVFVEIVGTDNRAYVDVIHPTSYYQIWVMPNYKLPVKADIDIKIDQPKAWDVVRLFEKALAFSRGVSFSVVDDYTVRMTILKTDPGLPMLVVVIIGIALVGIGLILNAIVRGMEVKVTGDKIEMLDTMRQRFDSIVDAMMAELKACGNDTNCVNRVLTKYSVILQSTAQVYGEIVRVLEEEKACDGLTIGGTCIPWWAVALVAAVVLVLLLR